MDKLHFRIQTNRMPQRVHAVAFPITSGSRCSTCPAPPCSPSRHERAHSRLPLVRSVYITTLTHPHKLMTAVPITRLLASVTPVASPTKRLRDPAICPSSNHLIPTSSGMLPVSSRNRGISLTSVRFWR